MSNVIPFTGKQHRPYINGLSLAAHNTNCLKQILPQKQTLFEPKNESPHINVMSNPQGDNNFYERYMHERYMQNPFDAATWDNEVLNKELLKKLKEFNKRNSIEAPEGLF